MDVRGEQMSGNVIERGALGVECDLEPRVSAFSWALSTWSTYPSPTTSVVLC